MVLRGLNYYIEKLYTIVLSSRYRTISKKSYISRKAILRGINKIMISSGVEISEHSIIDCAGKNDKRIKVGKNSIIHEFTNLKAFDGFIDIGDNCTVNSFCLMYGCEKGIKIGNGVRIATGCSLVANSHVFEDNNNFIFEQGVTSEGITIEDDVWLGSGVRVIDGVRIGKGSVIGANAVVNRDIPPYSIAVGVPAKVIKNRNNLALKSCK
jgi:acetyltransferase-like isoleucine patch superfamily enzyme